MGFKQLAKLTAKRSKSLQRMLSLKSEPSMNHLVVIFRAMREVLHVSLTGRS